MLNQQLYQKRGLIISHVANWLMTKKKGDKLPTFSEMQEQFCVSRGTVQNALKFLIDSKAVDVRARGRKGSYICNVDPLILQQYCSRTHISGIMPLPYSKALECLATALYKCFSNQHLKFFLSYTGGSSNRYTMLLSGAFDFAISSKAAALTSIERGLPIEVAMEFGSGSYLSKHVLVFSMHADAHLCDGLRIGIDNESFDQRQLTYRVFQSYNVELVEIKRQRFLKAIKEGYIDASIWNYDEIIEKEHDGFQCIDLEFDNLDDFSNAVILINQNDLFIKRVLEDSIHLEQVKLVREKVINNIIPPIY